MKQETLEEFQWLLQVSKPNLRYREQCAKWNRLQMKFRSVNEGLNKVPDHTGEPLSLYEGIYQD
jgi:hypothetical protein